MLIAIRYFRREMKKNLPLFLVLFFGACQAQTSTFVVRSLKFSDKNANIEFDANEDGLDDNQLPQWNALWQVLGFPVEKRYQALMKRGEFSVGFDLTEDSIRGFSLLGYRASFSGNAQFDGSDKIRPIDETFSFDMATLEEPLFASGSGFLEASSEKFLWPLIPIQSKESLEMPLEHVVISGSLKNNELTSGKIVGLVSTLSAALLLEKIPAVLQARQEVDARAYNSGNEPIPCEGTEDHAALVCQLGASAGFCSDGNPDGVVTGLCVAPESISAKVVSFLDEDGDGHFTVDFDEKTRRFVRNELAAMFDLSPKGAPEGLFGELFKIDQNKDGIKDSMAVALGFEAISAQRK